MIRRHAEVHRFVHAFLELAAEGMDFVHQSHVFGDALPKPEELHGQAVFAAFPGLLHIAKLAERQKNPLQGSFGKFRHVGEFFELPLSLAGHGFNDAKGFGQGGNGIIVFLLHKIPQSETKNHRKR